MCYASGRCVVTYRGRGTIRYTPNARRVESSRGRDVLDVDATRGGLGLFLTQVDPTNYVRGICVRTPVSAPAGDPFNPVFLDRIRSFRAIRFKDWGATDGNWSVSSGSQQRHWADRPRLDDAQ